MGSFAFRYDPSRKRLYLTLQGFFRDHEVEPLMAELNRVLGQVENGFDVVTDISGFLPASTGTADALRRAGEMVKARGRRHAVRVAGGPIAGLMQFKRLLGRTFNETEVRYARSVAEADTLLDQWPSPEPELSRR